MMFETVATALVVGILTGWVASVVMKSGGYGLTGDIALAVAGGLVGGAVGAMFGTAAAASRFAVIAAAAFLGAVVLIMSQRKLWHVNAVAAR